MHQFYLSLLKKFISLFLKKKKSIHLEKFLKFPKKFENLELNNKWLKLLKIRDICNLSIEQKRATKEIGSSLEASLILEISKKNSEIINEIDLSELCITSSVEIRKNDTDDIVVKTFKAKGDKCPVCWKISPEPCERHG